MVLKIFYIIVSLVLASSIKCFVDSDSKLNFLTRRSRCDSCRNELRFIDLAPLFSYIFLRGRCRYCHNKINKDVFFYELGTLVFILCYAFFDNTFIFLNLLDVSIVAVLYFLAIEDIKTFEVNSRLLFILFILSIFKVSFYFSFFDFFILIICYHLLYFITREGIGYGDIKIFCVLSLTINIYEAFYLLIFTFIYAGVVAVILLYFNKVTKKTKIALVPYILLSYITILIIREVILW